MAYYANLLCCKFEVNPISVSEAALLHDHGKYTWDKELFVKKNLTKDDWDIIKQHPKKSVDVALSLFPERKNTIMSGTPSIADLIELHHEKPDGSGYYGVKDIPVEAAILSVADVFDACLSDRVYRVSVLSKKDAVDIAIQPFKDFLDKRGYSSEIAENMLLFNKYLSKISVFNKKCKV